jgi:beta-lactamase regulating signal transducer with metallopeptidase domain
MTMVDSSTVEALGWALVHFVWQGALAGGLFAVLDLALRGGSPRLRYGLAALTLAAMAAMPLVTFVATRSGGSSPVANARASHGGDSRARVHRLEPAAGISDEAMRRRISGALPAVVALWGAGVVLLSIRYLGGFFTVRRLDRSARPASPDASERLDGLMRRMRITRPVRLLESTLVEVPTVVGWLRPAILLPVAALAGLSAEQLEALLAHELAHIRRQDYLVGLLQSAVETVLFYQPAVWWVSHRMRVERELCCDDEAVAACGNPVQYARALTDLAALRSAPVLAQAATGGALFQRISRLVAPSGHGARSSRAAAGVLGVAAMVVAAMGVTTLRASALPGQAVRETEGPPRTVTSPPAQRPRTSSSPAERRAVEVNGARPVPIERVIELASAGVTPEYIDELAALGYPSLSWDQLIAMRSQGVSPDFVRGLVAEGLKDLSMSDLVSLRNQGVSPEYVRGLRAAGYGGLSVTDLVGARSQGVSPEEVAEFKAMGYSDLTLSRLIGLRSQGVSPEYVRELQAEGYKGLSVPVLIGLRSQGVSVEYVRELKQLGYSGLAAGELIELRSQGVDPEFVRELKDAGYSGLTTRELIELRAHGVDPELLERLKTHKEGTR